MAFCACMRFSAWSKTIDCGPSSTPSVTSAPRCAGQAVHKHRGLLRVRHQLLIHLVRLEDGGALGGLVLHAHAGADVGVDGVGASGSFYGDRT